MQWLWRILTNFLRKLHQNTAAAPIKKAKRADTAFFQTQKKSRAFRKARRTSPRARPKAFSLEPRLLYHSRRGLGIVSAYSVDSVAQNAKRGRERRRFCTRTAFLRCAAPISFLLSFPPPFNARCAKFLYKKTRHKLIGSMIRFLIKERAEELSRPHLFSFYL